MARPKVIDGRFYGTGKRKNAVARVFLTEGSGQVEINGRAFADYFPRDVLRMIIEQPFDAIAKRDAYDVTVTVKGGGTASQAEAGSCSDRRRKVASPLASGSEARGSRGAPGRSS